MLTLRAETWWENYHAHLLTTLYYRCSASYCSNQEHWWSKAMLWNSNSYERNSISPCMRSRPYIIVVFLHRLLLSLLSSFRAVRQRLFVRLKMAKLIWLSFFLKLAPTKMQPIGWVSHNTQFFLNHEWLGIILEDYKCILSLSALTFLSKSTFIQLSWQLGSTSLIKSSAKGQNMTVKLLLEAGANKDAVDNVSHLHFRKDCPCVLTVKPPPRMLSCAFV